MLKFNADGLIPAIVQDAATGQVLMLAYMNQDAIDATTRTGLVTFWSRSRGELWEKGATSGNRLRLQEMHADCDGDTLLVLAEPTGPACHNGTVSCFDDSPPPTFVEFGRLWATIAARVEFRPEGSYTTSLLDDHDLAARKVMEEAGEVAFASKDIDARAVPVTGNVDTSTAEHQRLVEELADLTYHLLVLAAGQGLHPDDIGSELRSRA